MAHGTKVAGSNLGRDVYFLPQEKISKFSGWKLAGTLGLLIQGIITVI